MEWIRLPDVLTLKQVGSLMQYEVFELHHPAAALLFALEVGLLQSRWESTWRNKQIIPFFIVVLFLL